MVVKLKALEKTRSFYQVELEKGDLTGKERNSYLRALEIIKKCIEREKEVEGKMKDNKLIA